MSDHDLVVRGGTVVTAADTFRADIGIRGGRIATIADSLAAGRETIDADGLLVLPGGVDSHCHMDQPPFMGVESADDFLSGSLSAACGGNTTIMPFAMVLRDEPLRPAVEAYREKARGKAVIDYAIHLIVPDADAGRLGQELPPLIDEGYTSFKVFLTYEGLVLEDREMLDVLAMARREGALVMVHAENEHCIHWLTERLVASGRTSPEFHAAARPAAAEREATHRAIALAEIADAPILLVHVSAGEAMEQIEWAQDRGLRVYGETCPQYLFLSDADLARPGFEGAKYMCSPPPRAADNQEALWRGLRQGIFQVYSSDHAPYRFESDRGKKHHGDNPPFHKVPPGVPGIETRLPLLFSEGVGKGRLNLNRFVALTATNAARLYGVYPRKGTIAVGGDADLALWDPGRTVTIRHADLHDNMDYSPYEGMEVTGWPVTTISRGEVVVREAEPVCEPGRGRFLACGRPDSARPV